MKHAYLITAHKETRVLQTLLMLIDAPCLVMIFIYILMPKQKTLTLIK